MGELANNIHTSNVVDNNRFLFLVIPDEDEEDDIVTWEGSIKQMTKFHKKHIDHVKSDLVKQMNELSLHLDRNSERAIMQDIELKKSVNSVNTRM